MNQVYFDFKSILFLMVLVLIPFYSCEKEQDDVNPIPQTPLSGKLVLPANFPDDEITVTNLTQDVVLEGEDFEFENINTTIAFNETKDEIVYIGYPGTDESDNYELNAKETALFLSMSVIPYVHVPENRIIMLGFKNVLYDEVSEIPLLEKKIKEVVDNSGYLKITEVELELEKAVNAIVDLLELDRPNLIGKSNDFATYNTENMQVIYPEKDYDGDVFNEETGEYRIKRDFYSKYYSYVGLSIGKYNPETGEAQANPNEIIAYIKPYNYNSFRETFWPPNLNKISQYGKDLVNSLIYLVSNKEDTYHTKWNTTKTSVYFTAKPQEKDAFVFITAKNSDYVLFHNIAALALGALADKDILDDFTLYMFQNLHHRTVQIIDSYHEEGLDEAIEILFQDFILFLEKETSKFLTSKITEKAMNSFVKEGTSKWLRVWTAILDKTLLTLRLINDDSFSHPIDFEGKNPPSQPNIVLPGNFVQLDNLSSTILQWEASDIDEDELTYDVYLGDSKLENMTKIASDFKHTSLSVNLEENTRYLWRVVVSDGQYKSKGPIWEFINGGLPPEGETGGTVGSSSVLAYYLFNGNVNDESGNNHHAIVQGATLTSDRFGNSNRAYRFDGNGSKIRINNPFGNSLDINKPFAVSAWFKTNTNKPAGGIVTFHTACNSGTDDYFSTVFYGSSENKLAASVMDNAGKLQFDDFAVNDNVWHHLVLNYTGEKSELYLDGLRVDEYSGAPNINYNSTVDLVIGGYHTDNCSIDHSFEGSIDDVKIYYDKFLIPEEVTALYNE